MLEIEGKTIYIEGFKYIQAGEPSTVEPPKSNDSINYEPQACGYCHAYHVWDEEFCGFCGTGHHTISCGVREFRKPCTPTLHGGTCFSVRSALLCESLKRLDLSFCGPCNIQHDPEAWLLCLRAQRPRSIKAKAIWSLRFEIYNSIVNPKRLNKGKEQASRA